MKDRDEPVAELGPLQKEALHWRERLEREGRLRLGTQDWAELKISRPGAAVDIQASLRAVREDRNEIRRH